MMRWRWRWLRRLGRPGHDSPWEVVGCETVEPVLMFDETEIDIVRIAARETCRKYIFDFKHVPDGDQCTNALIFSQQQLLLREIAKGNYNVLLLEGWTLTRLRRGMQYRLEVDYIGRAGSISGKPPASRRPPFIAVLKAER